MKYFLSALILTFSIVAFSSDILPKRIPLTTREPDNARGLGLPSLNTQGSFPVDGSQAFCQPCYEAKLMQTRNLQPFSYSVSSNISSPSLGNYVPREATGTMPAVTPVGVGN